MEGRNLKKKYNIKKKTLHNKSSVKANDIR